VRSRTARNAARAAPHRDRVPLRGHREAERDAAPRSRQRAVSGSRTAPAHIHSATSAKLAMKMSSIAIRDCTNSGTRSPAARRRRASRSALRWRNHIARIAANSPSVPNSAA
jgi:hypothetical protein